MTENELRVFAVVKEKVLEVLGDIVEPDEVTPERSLAELGGNSIDRVEVTMMAMEDLGVTVPRAALAGVANLRQLTEILARHLDAA